MAKSSSFDYFIVGQGLAGSAMAVQLIKMGKRILVIDQPQNNISSSVAAGLFNPITGRRIVKTWMADTLFPYLHEYYRSVEALTNKKFFYSMPLFRPFSSFEEQNEWMAKSATPELDAYIHKIATRGGQAGVNDLYGGFYINQCGYLDTRQYMDSVSEFIRKAATLLIEEVHDTDIIVSDHSVHYKAYDAERIIFCNGGHSNKWFDWLPVLPLKGEAIRIESALPLELIINRGVYIVPDRVPGQWRVGATYNREDEKPGISAQGRAQLVEKLKELISIPFNVIGQEWGFRPTTTDRRPILGRHPEWAPVYIFNGMGTKGVSLSPYLSAMLIRSIENGTQLNKEVDIERYKVLYWTSPK